MARKSADGINISQKICHAKSNIDILAECVELFKLSDLSVFLNLILHSLTMWDALIN